MTQQLDPRDAADGRTGDQTQVVHQQTPSAQQYGPTSPYPGYAPSIPQQGYPSTSTPAQGYPSQGYPAQGYPAPGDPRSSHAPGYGPPPGAWGPYGPPPQQGPADTGRRSSGSRIALIVGALVLVVVLLGGLLTWMLVGRGSDTPAPAAAPSVSQDAPAPPGAESPAVAAAARQQLTDAIFRYERAANQFEQAVNASKTPESVRTAVTTFRAATYGYDADIRAITFPNQQQTIVNTQLLPATGRLIGDLDQLANLDPATASASADRAKQELDTTSNLTQQILRGLGG